MPSPLAHLAAGSAFAFFTGKTGNLRTSWRIWAVCLGFSMAPDADAVLGILQGSLAVFHNQFSHSLGFGIVLCAACLPLTRRMLPGWNVRGVFTLTIVCFGTHLLFDWMTYGRGVMLMWPFSSARFQSPVQVFHGLRWSEGVFSSTHLDTLINESSVIACVALAAWGLRLFLKQKQTTH
jgi:inner membrane protein